METTYTYSVSTDTLNGKVSPKDLHNTINSSDISIALIAVSKKNDDLKITFKVAISGSEELILDSIVSNHDGVEISEPEVEIDEEGRQISRVAAGKKGWVYNAHFFELETSKDGSLFCEDYTGTTCPSLSIKFYNNDNVEITDAGAYGTKQLHLDAECVKTEVLFKPNYDYELLSGTIRLDIVSTEDCRLWVIGGMLEIGAAGTKEFAKGMNLKYLGVDEVIETDGRASKYMSKDVAGVPYQANQIKFIIKHSAGYKFKIMPALEYFRE